MVKSLIKIKIKFLLSEKLAGNVNGRPNIIRHIPEKSLCPALVKRLPYAQKVKVFVTVKSSPRNLSHAS